MFYYKVSVFALGSLSGGHWEDDVLVSGRTPEDAYNGALLYLRAKGFAGGVMIDVCDENGEYRD
jgi:hypothetical protein